MKLSIRLFATASALSAAMSGLALAQSLVFSHVTVIDVQEGVARPGTTVVVAGARITAVRRGNELETPAGARIIDGTGKYLIPGLWDMHAHTSSDRITREILYPLFIAHGVTGIRNMKADCFETGHNACGPVESSIRHGWCATEPGSSRRSWLPACRGSLERVSGAPTPTPAFFLPRKSACSSDWKRSTREPWELRRSGRPMPDGCSPPANDRSPRKAIHPPRAPAARIADGVQ